MISPDYTHNDLKILREADSCLLRELCRRYLWIYCQVTEPDFYNGEHMYLKEICDRLQTFLEDEGRKYFVLSIPPQHGKSRTIKNMEAWIILNNKDIRFFSISYNEEYATDASKNLLATIRQEPEDDVVCFRDIADDIRIKKGDGAVNRWSVEGGYNTWLSASPNVGITGRSANIVIIDDIIKDYYTATNKRELSKIWTWFANTLFSRKGDNKQKIIVVMTRWAKHDLAGEILSRFSDVDNLVMRAYNPETDSMLCDAILNRDSYDEVLKTSSPDLVEANYNQQPIDVKGQLYTHFNTYKSLDGLNIKRINMVCDTADEGSDWLCGIVFAETFDHKAYLIDVLYTREPVEKTIPRTAQFIHANRAERSVIESNNGGKLFALSVKKELNTTYHNYSIIKWFHQSRNKVARIITAAYDVQQRVYFPEGWQRRWPEFAENLSEYQREGQNEHDDAPDCLTMVVELMDNKLKMK